MYMLMEMNTQTAVGLGISVFVAGFLCTQFLSHVLTLDSLLTFLTTTWIAWFGRNWLSTMAPNCPVDALHEYLLNQLMTVVLVPALVWFLSTDPTDVTIRTALALTRVVGFGLVAVVTYVSQLRENCFDDSSYKYLMIPSITLAVVYTVHLLYNSRINTNIRYGNLNIYLSVELVLAGLHGLACLGAPRNLASLFGQELDSLHTYLYRVYGAMTLGFICLPWAGPRFRSKTNKRAVLFSRALNLLVMMLVTFSKYRRGDIPEGPGSKTMITGLILLTLPSAVGSMRNDHMEGWDLPWRGLRVPDVSMGGGSPKEVFKKASPRRRPRSRRRGRSRSRRS